MTISEVSPHQVETPLTDLPVGAELYSNPYQQCLFENKTLVRQAMASNQQGVEITLQLVNEHESRLTTCVEGELEGTNLRMIEALLWAFGADTDRAVRYQPSVISYHAETVTERVSAVPLDESWYLKESEQNWTWGQAGGAQCEARVTMVTLCSGQMPEPAYGSSSNE